MRGKRVTKQKIIIKLHADQYYSFSNSYYETNLKVLCNCYINTEGRVLDGFVGTNITNPYV